MENEYLKIFLMAMLPIAELRLSIPVGLLEYNLSWVYVFIASIAGNFIICIPIIYGFRYAERILRKNYYSRKFLERIFRRTRSRGRIINLYKYYGLILFVAIPFPLTGAWTGCLASYLFGFSKKKSLIAIMLGLIISASLVTIITKFLSYLLIYIGYDTSL